MSRKTTKAAGRVGGANDGATAKAPKRAKKGAATIVNPKSAEGETIINESASAEPTTAGDAPAENSQNVVDSSAQSAVESESSNPDANAIPATAEPATQPIAKGFHMDLTLVRGNTSKNGKRVSFSNPALVAPLVFPVRAFATVPDALTLSGDGFKTRSAEEQAKAEARNAKRAEKGLKPKLTPQERAKQLAERTAKLSLKLERAQKASARLAAKLGTAAPGADAASAPATVEATPEAPAVQ